MDLWSRKLSLALAFLSAGGLRYSVVYSMYSVYTTVCMLCVLIEFVVGINTVMNVVLCVVVVYKVVGSG